MTRKSERELESEIERLETLFGSEDHRADPIKTEEEIKAECDAYLAKVTSEFDEVQRLHFENVLDWIGDEGVTTESEPHGVGEATNSGLTAAGHAYMDMLTGARYPAHEAYWERFPDAPRPGMGEEYA